MADPSPPTSRTNENLAMNNISTPIYDSHISELSEHHQFTTTVPNLTGGGTVTTTSMHQRNTQSESVSSYQPSTSETVSSIGDVNVVNRTTQALQHSSPGPITGYLSPSASGDGRVSQSLTPHVASTNLDNSTATYTTRHNLAHTTPTCRTTMSHDENHESRHFRYIQPSSFWSASNNAAGVVLSQYVLRTNQQPPLVSPESDLPMYDQKQVAVPPRYTDYMSSQTYRHATYDTRQYSQINSKESGRTIASQYTQPPFFSQTNHDRHIPQTSYSTAPQRNEFTHEVEPSEFTSLRHRSDVDNSAYPSGYTNPCDFSQNAEITDPNPRDNVSNDVGSTYKVCTENSAKLCDEQSQNSENVRSGIHSLHNRGSHDSVEVKDEPDALSIQGDIDSVVDTITDGGDTLKHGTGVSLKDNNAVNKMGNSSSSITSLELDTIQTMNTVGREPCGMPVDDSCKDVMGDQNTSQNSDNLKQESNVGHEMLTKDIEINGNKADIQHLLHVAGSDITIEVTIKGLELREGYIITREYNVTINKSNAVVLLGVMGYEQEHVVMSDGYAVSSVDYDSADNVAEEHQDESVRDEDHVNESTIVVAEVDEDTKKQTRQAKAKRKFPVCEKKTKYPVPAKKADRHHHCEECGYKTCHPHRYRNHLRTHTGEKPHKCPVCDVGFAEKSSVTRHLCTHSDARPFVCTHCDRAFKYRSALRTHERKAHSQIIKQEPVAAEEYLTDTDVDESYGLDLHTGWTDVIPALVKIEMSTDGDPPDTRVNDDEYELVSVIKQEPVAVEEYLTDTDVLWVIKQEPVAVEEYLTDTDVDESYGLDLHTGWTDVIPALVKIEMARDGDPRDTEWGGVAPHCPQPAADNTISTPPPNIPTDKIPPELTAAQRKKRHKCDKCSYRTCRPNRLSKHMETHTGEPYMCIECGAEFMDVEKFKVHKHFHRDERAAAKKSKKEQNLICEVCGYVAGTPSNLKIHMRKHTGFKPFMCCECGATFGYKQAMMTHMRLHTGETPFHCDQCGYQAKQLSHLREHMAKHTPIKSLKCTLCDYRCTINTALQRHMRNHLAERLFVCSECGYKFKRLNHLRRHSLVHTGERPYHCTECDTTYKQSGDLSRHKSKKHNKGNIDPVVVKNSDTQLTAYSEFGVGYVNRVNTSMVSDSLHAKYFAQVAEDQRDLVRHPSQDGVGYPNSLPTNLDKHGLKCEDLVRRPSQERVVYPNALPANLHKRGLISSQCGSNSTDPV